MTTNYLDGEIDRSSLETKTDRRIEQHKLAEGNNILRILPPFGTNHNKTAFAEWTLHWGLLDKDGNKRPIVCTYKYEKYCPICEITRDLYKRKTALIKDYMDADNKKVIWERVPEDIKARYTTLNKDWEDLKSNTHYFYNAIDLNHSIKILSLSKMAHDGLKVKMLEAMDKYGIAPASLNAGCYFNISKIKTGPRTRDVKYQVELYKTMEKDAQGVAERVLKTALPDAIINSYDKLAYDIHVLYPVRPASDIVKILNGDGSVFDKEREIKKEKGNLNPEQKATPSAETSKDHDTQHTMTLLPVTSGTITSKISLGSGTPTVQPLEVKSDSVNTSVQTINDLKKLLGL